jgi:ABC-type iron transport system FetAB permease component
VLRGLVIRSLRSGMIPLIDSTKTTGIVFFTHAHQRMEPPA